MRIRFILGEDAVNQDNHQESHPIFSEMQEFHNDEGTDGEWKETARYYITN